MQQKDYKQEIVSHWPLINRLAGRRFSGAFAEEAALYVLNRLEEDDCRRVQSFSGRAKFSTFLASLVVRLLEDFSRKRFGRVRPPQWVSVLGGIWGIVFELLCLQRLSVADAVETMLHRVPDRRKVEEVAWTILEKITDCGKAQALDVEFDDEEIGRKNNDHDMPDHLKGPEEHLLEDERRIFFTILFKGVITGKEKLSATEQSFCKILDTEIMLSGQERLLLKLCFQDGVSVSKAGSMLGMNANQAHGRLRRLLVRLREDFEQIGIDKEFRALLDVV